MRAEVALRLEDQLMRSQLSQTKLKAELCSCTESVRAEVPCAAWPSMASYMLRALLRAEMEQLDSAGKFELCRIWCWLAVWRDWQQTVWRLRRKASAMWSSCAGVPMCGVPMCDVMWYGVASCGVM